MDDPIVQGKDPVVEGDHRLRQIGVLQHAGLHVDDGIQLALFQHAEGALQRQVDEPGLVATAGKGLCQQIQLDAAALVLDHVRRNGEIDAHPQWLGGQGAHMQQQGEAQQAVKEAHACSQADDSV
ncbi:hypothetical protein D3C77_498130 [compost metagenome]